MTTRATTHTTIDRVSAIPRDLHEEISNTAIRMGHTMRALIPLLIQAGLDEGKHIDATRTYHASLRGREHINVHVGLPHEQWDVVDALASLGGVSSAIATRQLILWGLPALTNTWEQQRDADTHARIMRDLGML